jgi:hypothetical protein
MQKSMIESLCKVILLINKLEINNSLKVRCEDVGNVLFATNLVEQQILSFKILSIHNFSILKSRYAPLPYNFFTKLFLACAISYLRYIHYQGVYCDRLTHVFHTHLAHAVNIFC